MFGIIVNFILVINCSCSRYFLFVSSLRFFLFLFFISFSPHVPAYDLFNDFFINMNVNACVFILVVIFVVIYVALKVVSWH